jgi:hypothetical protein
MYTVYNGLYKDRKEKFLRQRESLPECMTIPGRILPVIIACIFMTTACSIDPEKNIVKDAIIKHFESRGYRVVEIEIQKVEQFPLGKREYMAPKKYTVQIPLIKLDESEELKGKGQSLLTFRNASITIRSTEKHGVWMVENIEGIPLT